MTLERRVRVSHTHGPSDPSPSARRLSGQSFWQRQKGQIGSLWRPPMAHRWSKSVSAQYPDAPRRQGTHGPHARTLRCLAERAGASRVYLSGNARKARWWACGGPRWLFDAPNRCQHPSTGPKGSFGMPGQRTVFVPFLPPPDALRPTPAAPPTPTRSRHVVGCRAHAVGRAQP